MMTSMVDVAVIGCGIVGAATAYELSRYDLSVTVLEAANDVADGTTKANSAILHAGYDPHPGTRMAALNVEGARLAKELCAKLQVSYKQIGSLVLAFDEEDLVLVRELYHRGATNGVPGLQLLAGARVERRSGGCAIRSQRCHRESVGVRAGAGRDGRTQRRADALPQRSNRYSEDRGRL